MARHVLPRKFYDRDVVTVAKALLGKLLIRESDEGATLGRIVEAEAYLAQEDSASHSACGKTRRNASMFGPPGHAYVYTIHSRFCLNAVTEPEEVASAVLIRAVEPLDGLTLMQRRRRCDVVRDLARGPGRLCEAFAIDRSLDGWDLTVGERLWVAEDKASGMPMEIVVTRRVGVTSAHELPLRFFVAGSRFVSAGRAADSRTSGLA
jgi:DNA-3-methyladenine glycosylase